LDGSTLFDNSAHYTFIANASSLLPESPTKSQFPFITAFEHSPEAIRNGLMITVIVIPLFCITDGYMSIMIAFRRFQPRLTENEIATSETGGLETVIDSRTDILTTSLFTSLADDAAHSQNTNRQQSFHFWNLSRDMSSREGDS
jgi:hypothetical protein